MFTFRYSIYDYLLLLENNFDSANTLYIVILF